MGSAAVAPAYADIPAAAKRGMVEAKPTHTKSGTILILWLVINLWRGKDTTGVYVCITFVIVLLLQL